MQWGPPGEGEVLGAGVAEGLGAGAGGGVVGAGAGCTVTAAGDPAAPGGAACGALATGRA
jgi:hypothetical protein